jgi:hypothetical protein
MKQLITIGLVLSFLPVVGFAKHPQRRGATPSVSSTSTIASYKVVDVMPSFWQFWEQSQSLDKEAKIRLFRQLVFEPNKEVFEAFTGKADDARLAQYLEKVQKYIPAMRRFYGRLITELPRAGRSFAKKFPDGNGNGTIYFMPNLLGGWDAGGGDLSGHPLLLFGVDSIVQIHKEGFNLPTLFHHELFHLYHNQLHPEWRDTTRGKDIPLYRLLWSEGLATYVAKVLNPKASDEDVVLATPLIQQTEALMPKLVKELRENLDSTSMDSVRNFLSGSPISKDIPARCGYYIGMLVARELNRKHSLRELARLRDQQLRREIETVLIKIETRYTKLSRPS